MSAIPVRSHVSALFALAASALLAIALLLTVPSDASADPVLPDKAALNVPDAGERAAVDAYFDAGAGAPTTVSFTGNITLDDVTLEGTFTLDKSAVAGVDHDVTIADMAVLHEPAGTGGITISLIDEGIFAWGPAGFSGTAAAPSVTAFAGNTATQVGLAIENSDLYLQVNEDSTFAYYLTGTSSIIGADDLSTSGSGVAEWNSTGTAIDESVDIGGASVAISLPVGADALVIESALLSSNSGPDRVADVLRFVQTGPPAASDTGLLILGDGVVTELGGVGEPRLGVVDGSLVGLVLPSGSHALQGAGPGVFENIDEAGRPTLAGVIVFEENSTAAALQESFEVGGSTFSIDVADNPPGFSGSNLELEILGMALLGNAEFSQTVGNDIAMTFSEGQAVLGDGTTAVATLDLPTATFLITTEGVQASAAGDLSFTSDVVSLTGSPSLEIDTTIVASYSQIVGTGIELTVMGRAITGDILFEAASGAGSDALVVATLANATTSFHAGTTEVIALADVGGFMLLSADGIAAELGADTTVVDGVTPTILAGVATLQINTTGAPVSEAFSLGGLIGTIDVSAGPYVRLAFQSASLRVPAAILNGDFLVDEIQLAGEKALRWSMMNISFDTGALGMVDGEGAFLTTAAGTAGSIYGNGIFAEPSTVGLRHNDTGGAVDEIIEFSGAPYVILFNASEGDLSVAFTDDEDPSIAITAPADESAVFPDDVVTVAYSCDDAGGSGLILCEGSVDGLAVPSGTTMDTGDVGVFVLTVLAVDGAGNSTESSVTLTVKQRRPGDDQVVRLYQAAFGRAPDAGGLAFWIDVFREGATLEQIAVQLLASPEAVALYGVDGSAEDYVRALYLNALGRSADAGGLAFWISELADSSRSDLLVSFSESPENIDRTGTTPPLTSDASKLVRLYQAAFGRDPDAGGQAFWESVFADGSSLRDIAAQFLTSPEAIARFGEDPTNEDFVDALYRNVLGRPGDAGGVAFWLEEMQTGATNLDVLVSFSESPENIDRTGTRP